MKDTPFANPNELKNAQIGQVSGALWPIEASQPKLVNPTFSAKVGKPAKWDFFVLKLALGAPKSARIEKIKKYGFFKVNSEQGYFFDFSDSGPCGLPGGGFVPKILPPCWVPVSRPAVFSHEIGPGGPKKCPNRKIKKIALS